jgi:hypothetical protein
MTRAVQAMHWRVRPEAPDELKDVADEALNVMVRAMRLEIHRDDRGDALKAATLLREEVCGPVTQRLEHTGPGGVGAVIVEVREYGKAEADEDADEPVATGSGGAADVPAGHLGDASDADG